MQILTSRWSNVGRVMQLALEGVAGATLFALMLLTTADVVGRYFFNLPILGTVELTQQMLATASSMLA